MDLWNPAKIVRVYEGVTRDAAIRLAGRDAYSMAQEGFEVTEARWSPPQVAPEAGRNVIRRAGSAIARVVGRRTPGILIVTWTQTAEGPITGTPGGTTEGTPGDPARGATKGATRGTTRGTSTG